MGYGAAAGPLPGATAVAGLTPVLNDVLGLFHAIGGQNENGASISDVSIGVARGYDARLGLIEEFPPSGTLLIFAATSAFWSHLSFIQVVARSGGRYTVQQIQDAVEALQNDGQLYSTKDDQHYKPCNAL